MEEFQYIKKLIESGKNYEIDLPRNIHFEDTYASFEGIPRKHPTDTKVLVLFTSPFSEDRSFYEFSVDSIGRIEELGTITAPDGQSAYTIRVWVKKGMPALQSKPFIVE